MGFSSKIFKTTANCSTEKGWQGAAAHDAQKQWGDTVAERE